jgi:hypothetical protein
MKTFIQGLLKMVGTKVPISKNINMIFLSIVLGIMPSLLMIGILQDYMKLQTILIVLVPITMFFYIFQFHL